MRYAVLHMYGYNTENRNDVLARLQEFAQYLRLLSWTTRRGSTRLSAFLRERVCDTASREASCPVWFVADSRDSSCSC